MQSVPPPIKICVAARFTDSALFTRVTMSTVTVLMIKSIFRACDALVSVRVRPLTTAVTALLTLIQGPRNCHEPAPASKLLLVQPLVIQSKLTTHRRGAVPIVVRDEQTCITVALLIRGLPKHATAPCADKTG